ncbi:hypothetical protein AXA59_03120 [Enterobacter hormaechei]|nr:hypothetical protein AM401_10520 [Enterobacter cloacae complex sp.]AXO43846.1 hypothetical protein AXA59_03120 [Enterobacter hormaechei]RTM40955.1 hypothetical protein EKO13_00390 [Enterobacter hormaechei subsp. xiangfangensis]PNP16893.1 hypothetical protein MC57_015830 [Enterobacter hormaechei]RTM71006.1 hypothetical protein EKO07_13990 [Enterobacter hormaechei subsp. xiangfangensis]
MILRIFICVKSYMFAGRGESENGKMSKFQATKNPSTLNQNGGVDGLHKLGTSKKSSGTSYDCTLRKKFCA